MVDPIIMDFPSDLTVEPDYTGQSISWIATDSNPYNYTIEFQGSEIVAGPTPWTSDVANTFNIPDGFIVGIYIYTVNFTDDYGNFVLHNFTFTVVDDMTNPVLTNIPNNQIVKSDYTGQNISWTATDLNPNTYTIELNGSGIVAGPNAWISGVAITYNIPDDLAAGVYVYTVTFTDAYGNSISNSVTFTVEDDGGGIPGASFEIILLVSIGTVASIVIMKRKKYRSNLE